MLTTMTTNEDSVEGRRIREDIRIKLGYVYFERHGTCFARTKVGTQESVLLLVTLIPTYPKAELNTPCCGRKHDRDCIYKSLVRAAQDKHLTPAALQLSRCTLSNRASR